jgi:hypothetical protein
VIHNQSDAPPWTIDGLTYTELIRQAYSNCAFSAGLVRDHSIDTLYLRFARGDEVVFYLLRPDEAAAIAWCLTGVLWSLHVGEVKEDE